jgi:TonB-dependent receptor
MIKQMFLAAALVGSGISELAAEPIARILLKGRVVDDERNPLPGAHVRVEGVGFTAVTDLDGFYTLPDIPVGQHTFRVSYLGYAPTEMTFRVAHGTESAPDITMRESSSELAEVVVAGAFGGQHKAVNLQKSNLNISNVVSADRIGKFPDSNIGDALKRISGINVQYDQGEARFGQVRGTPADFSSVTINGSRMPSAEGDVRSVQLDLIPSDMIAMIEVSKTLTPDQDGDAIGGSINLVTKSSPSRPTLNATASTGYNAVSRKAQLNLGLTAGSRFFDDRLGVMLAASCQNAPAGSYNTEFTWEKSADGSPRLSEYQIRQYYVTRERQSYSLALDYAFDTHNKLRLQGLLNNRNDWENRYRTTLKGITPDGVAEVRVQTKAGTPGNNNARLEKQRTLDLTMSGENRAGIATVDWKLGYARASELRPDERYLDLRLKKQQFALDISDPRRPWASPLAGSTMTLDDRFALRELTQQQQEIVEQDVKGAVDLLLNLGRRAKLKVGGKYVYKSKRRERDFYEYTPVDAAGFMADVLANTAVMTTDRFMPSAKYQAGVFADKAFVGGLSLSDPALFVGEQVASELASNYDAYEAVGSAYVRFDYKLTSNLVAMGGLRMEHTASRYKGHSYDDATDTVEPGSSSTSTYCNFLPSLLLKWEPVKDLPIRFGYNRSLARPKYSALVPGMNINRGDNRLKIGNPDLKATTSHNLDLNAEYYVEPVGLMSVGAFYKRIEGFIVDEVLYDQAYAGQVWSKLTQPKNAGNADIAGIELACQRDFGFIHPALRCLGLYGTYTFTHSRVSDFSFEGREDERGLSLPGSPKHTANASLSVEKRGWSARVSYNYASAFIDEMGTEPFYDRYYDAVGYLDLSLAYTFGRKAKTTFFADCTNLLNRPLRYYQGSKDLSMQQEYYGVKFSAGIKIKL